MIFSLSGSKGLLTVAEQQLAKSHPSETGRDLLKQVRSHLIETARPVLEELIQRVTGVKVVSLHHDVSTVTGEKIVIFTLAESPAEIILRSHSRSGPHTSLAAIVRDSRSARSSAGG